MCLKRESSFYFFTVLVNILLAMWLLNVFKNGMLVPWAYEGDAAFNDYLVKTIIKTGWFASNPMVGLPAIGELYDFSSFFFDTTYFTIIKFISIFTNNWIVVLNVFYLSGYALISFCMAFFLRNIKFSYLIAFLGSIMYTFTPYHAFRGTSHIFLSYYYIIPLVGLVLYWMYNGVVLNFIGEQFRYNKVKLIGSAIICILIGMSGVYYAFFSCFLIVFVGVLSTVKYKERLFFITSIILISIVCLTICINFYPYILYILKNGQNVERPLRSISETDLYGLRLSSLFLPTSFHRMGIISKLSSDFYNNFGMNIEQISWLGFFPVIGLIYQFITIFIKDLKMTANQENLFWARLTLITILFSSIGGFSNIFAYFVSPQIRAWGRFQIFISFFSICSFLLIMKCIEKSNLYKKSNFSVIFVLIIAVIAFFDMTPKSLNADYSLSYYNDHKFFQELERNFDKGSKIFQLPYVRFPESPPSYHMSDYTHFRAYLHTDNIKWSYGAMKGRKADLWQREVSSLGADEMIKALIDNDFSGIEINLNGFEDNGVALITEIQNITQQKVFIDQNANLAYIKFDKNISSLDWFKQLPVAHLYN